MTACYYCGAEAHLECDAITAGEPPVCGRAICHRCAVPEFEGGNVEHFTLCKHHAHMQIRKGEPIRDWADRVYGRRGERKEAG